jgi:hypothetical protein
VEYDLTRLGDAEFEHMAQALGIAVLGSAVTVFGDGPDGGREATFRGQCSYPEPVPPEGLWNGYGVLQAKYRSRLTSTAADTKWFLDQLRTELRTWADPESARRQRGRLPDYLVLATNVPLSADPQRGGIDAAGALIEAFREELGLKGWAVWPHDQLCRYLDVHDGVRRTYGGLTTTGDVLADVQRALADLDPARIHEEPLGSLLTKRAAKELLAQQWVRLSEAGHPTNAKLMLSDVAVDLPARAQGAPLASRIAGTVAHVVTVGDSIRRPRRGLPATRHITLVGGPGQGKTTLGQLICQTYRVAILEDRPQHTLGPEVPRLVEQYRTHLDAISIPRPQCRRWPVRVVLSEYADALDQQASLSLLEYIARQTQDVSPINTTMLRRWLREWPWLLVLDGLDEVADPKVRELTLTRISDFYIDAADVQADLLAVATTRPQGYQDELDAGLYDHLLLEPMGLEDALRYARHLTDVRFGDDPEMHDRVLTRLQVAGADPHTSRLLRTPLQVTIMSILLERRTRAPRDRYGLFEAYYTTLYDREVAKDTPTARFLDDHRRNVDHIHERVGRTLQMRAQHAGESDPRLPRSELREIAIERLLREEHTQVRAEQLADELATAATNRLVMLVGYPQDTVGFEIRSLQELMAARSLFAGDEQGLLASMRVLALSAHWRNTWVFAASRIFAEREALRDQIILILEELDSRDPLFAQLQPGARLAMALLDEDIAVGHPSHTRMLLTRALRLLETTFPGETPTSLARVTHEAVSQDTALPHSVLPIVDKRLRDADRVKATTLDFLAAWAELPGPASIAAQNRIKDRVRTPPIELEPIIKALRAYTSRGAWTRAPETAHTPSGAEAEDGYRRTVRELAPTTDPTTIATLQRVGRLSKPVPELADPKVQEAIVRTFNDPDQLIWHGPTVIEQMLLRRISREPVPDQHLDGQPLPTPR